MPTYILLAKWTDQGMRGIADGPKRLEAARRALAEMGGQIRTIYMQIRTIYMTLGEYDLAAVCEAPDDAVWVRFTLMLGRLGDLRTTSMKAFPEDAYRGIAASLA